LIQDLGGSCRTGFMLARLQVLMELKHRISDEWDKIDQQLIDSAIKQWRKRLAACVSTRGGHTEHNALKQKSKLINSLPQ